ncbi:MAG: class I SAM-dependent methyltransferase [Caldilineaceae bacterium]|nr:class I SAM-dependent methyltransferase [Caldilineaceae bacterium]
MSAQNRTRWNALSKAGVLYARPFLSLNRTEAHRFLDTEGLMDPPEGKRVLVLAGGGGQQSACLALLGAKVTVLDLSDEQLERDREAARALGLQLDLHQGDMRDLSRFDGNSFDMVYHPHSINFIPDVDEVFAEVARVLAPGGQYRVDWHNPFTQLVDDESYRDGVGYGLLHPYRDGEVDLQAVFGSDQWPVELADGSIVSMDHPRSWIHTLGTFVGELAHNGFVILGIGEETSTDDEAEPGSWEHFKRITVPYLRVWTRLVPEAFGSAQR